MDYKLNVALNEVTKHVFNFFYDNIDREFGTILKENEDIHGTKFNVIVKFMTNKNRANVDSKVFDLAIEGGKDVRVLIKYIIENLKYNSNVIPLKGVNLSKELNLDTSNISKALKYLRNKQVIIKAKSLDIWKDNLEVDDDLYIVNIDYIYKGNINEIVKQFEKQKQIFDALLTDAIEEKAEENYFLE